MKNNFLLFPVLFLLACSTQAPKEVLIPVATKCPAPEIPPRPYLPIADLKKGDKPDVVMKAYVVSVVKLKGDNDEMRAKWGGYN